MSTDAPKLDCVTEAYCIFLYNVGENSIVIASGANDQLSPADIQKAESLISSAAVVICQLEVPLETSLAALALAKKHGGINQLCHNHIIIIIIIIVLSIQHQLFSTQLLE